MMEKNLTDIAENIKELHERVAKAAAESGRAPTDIQLMAVTKTVPANLVNHAVSCGIKLLGENRAQELLQKYENYPKNGVDIHFIGHLQTNKVHQIIDKVCMIQSVGSEKLALEIANWAQKSGKTMDILVEVNIGGELSKAGVEPQRLEELLHIISSTKGIKARGLMAIPPPSSNNLQNERYFYKVKQLSVDIQSKKIDNISMEFLSMGMSEDFEAAIRQGSGIVRLGTAIFGQRNR